MRAILKLFIPLIPYSCQGAATSLYGTSCVNLAPVLQPLTCDSGYLSSIPPSRGEGLNTPLSPLTSSGDADLDRSASHEADIAPLSRLSGWEVKLSPGKGLGVFATSLIRAGDRIMVERPLFTIVPPTFEPGKGYQLSGMAASLDAAVAALSDTQREEFASCHQHRLPGEGDGDRNMVIFRSNAYTLTDGTIAMFPKIARINHSCRPSAANIWSPASGLRIIWAARDIQPGEEVTVTYAPLLKKSEERQSRLTQYGFRCDCDACRDHEHTDVVRVKMARLLDELEDRLSRRTSNVANKKLLPKAIELTRMLEEEHMMDYLPHALHLASELSRRLGDIAAAVEWSRHALRLHECADEMSNATRSEREYLDGLAPS